MNRGGYPQQAVGFSPHAQSGFFPFVLLVDDDPLVHELVRFALEGRYRVVGRTDPAEGLQAAFLQAPSAILLDMHMPGMSGLEFFSRLRRRPGFFSLPVLFLTADDVQKSELQARACGAAAYLHKPFDPAGLVTWVDRVLCPAQAPATA